MMTRQVILYLLNDKKDSFVPVSWCQKLQEWQPLAIDDPLVFQITEANDPILAKNLIKMAADEKMAERIKNLFKQLSIFLIVPIHHRDHLIGFLTLDRKITKVRYTYEDMTLLTVLSNQLGIAIVNVMLYHELRQESNVGRKPYWIGKRLIGQPISPFKNIFLSRGMEREIPLPTYHYII